jgi:hypothetical protein
VFLYGTTSEKTNYRRLLKEYLSKVALAALVPDHDHICFGDGCVPSVTVRATGKAGRHERACSKMDCSVFYGNGLAVCAMALRREFPDAIRNSLWARRNSSEDLLLALATRTGQRPSVPKASEIATMHQAESILTIGKSAFRAKLMVALNVDTENYDRTERAQELMEMVLNIVVCLAILKKCQRGSVDDRCFDNPDALPNTIVEEGQRYDFDPDAPREASNRIIYDVGAWFINHVVTGDSSRIFSIMKVGGFRKAGFLQTVSMRRVFVFVRGETEYPWLHSRLVIWPKNTYHWSWLTQHLAVVWGRIKCTPSSVYWEGLRQEAVAIAQPAPKWQAHDFPAASTGSYDSLFPVTVPIPEACLDLWKRLYDTNSARSL